MGRNAWGRRSPEEKARIVRLWQGVREEHSMTQAEFCAHHGIMIKTLWTWCQHYSPAAKGAA